VSSWGAATDFDIVCRRAAGRRRYNAQRRAQKQYRRAQILCRTVGLPRGTWGLQAALARALGVSPSTICRDMQAIRDADRGALLC
jgi:hypothetical protein